MRLEVLNSEGIRVPKKEAPGVGEALRAVRPIVPEIDAMLLPKTASEYSCNYGDSESKGISVAPLQPGLLQTG